MINVYNNIINIFVFRLRTRYTHIYVIVIVKIQLIKDFSHYINKG